MHVNRIGSQNFNGLTDFLWSCINSYDLSSRIDSDSNPVGWYDEIQRLSSESDSYTSSTSRASSSSVSQNTKGSKSTLLGAGAVYDNHRGLLGRKLFSRKGIASVPEILRIIK